MYTLLINGRNCWTKFNDDLYVCSGGYGGEPNEYYIPTKFTIANPVLGSKIVDISADGDGVLMTLTDTDYLTIDNESDIVGGLYSLLYVTAHELADIYISINVAVINSRVMAINVTDNESQKISMENIMRDLYDGKPYKILTTDLISKFNVNPLSSNNSIAQIIQQQIETAQYILANFYHSIGINSNYNMKRERLISNEIDINAECLYINILDAVNNVKNSVEKINSKFGTTITVRLSDEWRRYDEVKSNINNTDNNDIGNVDNVDNGQNE